MDHDLGSIALGKYAGLILVAGGILIQSAHGGFKVVSDIVNYFKTDVAHTRANPITAIALAYGYNPSSESSGHFSKNRIAVSRFVLSSVSPPPLLLVEVGVLLDLFVAIFVMGIIINHISREFTSISTEHLAALRD